MEDRNIEELLGEEIAAEIEAISELEPGSKEKSTAIDDLTKLYKLRIEENKSVWNLCTFSDEDGVKQYQCKRMSSLFKKVAADGTVTYSDTNRYYGVNNDNHNASYHSGLIDRVMDELYPITMPYIPFDKPFKVYTEDFLTDSKNGDFDTRGLLYAIDPHGNRIEINRYFKDAPVGFDEINKAEYEERRKMAEKRQEEMKNGLK